MVDEAGAGATPHPGGSTSNLASSYGTHLLFLPAATLLSTTMTTSFDRLSSQEATRVQDYLSDKIQSLADLESLDSLLSNLGAQHELQRKQVNFPSSFFFGVRRC